MNNSCNLSHVSLVSCEVKMGLDLTSEVAPFRTAHGLISHQGGKTRVLEKVLS